MSICIFQFYVTPHTSVRYEEHFVDLIDGDTLVRRLSLEYVCGLYFPSQRRLIVCGTHISDQGRCVIGLDRYDVTLDPDGLAVKGSTCGYEVGWPNEFKATAHALPRAPLPGVEFREIDFNVREEASARAAEAPSQEVPSQEVPASSPECTISEPNT